MASSFRIPKKKVPSDSPPLHRESPLSRLQCPAPQPQGYGHHSGPGTRVHAGKPGGSSEGAQQTPSFRDMVKTLLGINGPNGGTATAANHGAAGGATSQSQPSRKAEWTGLMNGRQHPKRGSDQLLRPEDACKPEAPPQKKKWGESAAKPVTNHSDYFPDRTVSVDSIDSLAELRGAKHAGSSSKDNQRRSETKTGSSPECRQKQQKSSSEEDITPPSRTSDVHRAAASSVSKVAGEGRRGLERTCGGGLPLEDVREQQRARWLAFKEKKKSKSNSARVKQTSSETIVLSSEDEEPKTSSSNRLSADTLGQKLLKSAGFPSAAPSFLQLDFLSLHAGLTDAGANGPMKITESGVNIPLKGTENGEEAEVTVVASQLRGYGLWDGGVARGGALLAGWEGPAPSLLFLWMSEAQASLLQRELVDVCSSAATGPPCSFLLLVLKEQLQELQAALLASILDMEEYRQGRASFKAGPTSPLDWADGLLLLHTCPPPQDQHLLRLLGRSKSEQPSGSQKNGRALQQLPTRLIQYPVAPCKGRITVTQEDLVCLNSGEFLNDVIIDFYLKYLLLEGVGGAVAERSHVFSSFFFKQLSRRRAAGEDDAPSVPDRHVRHQRVKTWTRHVDIFTKDFLIIPVNQEAHWFLVVVCYPGLEEICYEDFERRAGRSDQCSRKNNFSPKLQQPPKCTLQGWTKNTVLKRPCILVMDSLKLSYHGSVCRLIRDYLQVEWDVRRSTPRLFSEDAMRSCSCRVPQQDNSIDCGVYLLQYAHSFLQNPVVHFDLPLQLDGWFPRQQVRQKREEIRRLILRLKDEAT